VATLTNLASDNPAVLTVDAPVGMSSRMHASGRSARHITATVTWNDGVVGPFIATLPVTTTLGRPTRP